MRRKGNNPAPGGDPGLGPALPAADEDGTAAAVFVMSDLNPAAPDADPLLTPDPPTPGNPFKITIDGIDGTSAPGSLVGFYGPAGETVDTFTARIRAVLDPATGAGVPAWVMTVSELATFTNYTISAHSVTMVEAPAGAAPITSSTVAAVAGTGVVLDVPAGNPAGVYDFVVTYSIATGEDGGDLASGWYANAADIADGEITQVVWWVWS